MAITGSADTPNTEKVSRHKLSYSPTRNILALILREMSTRYGRTPGGYIWGVIEPLAAIIFLAIGFSLLLRSPSLGTSFILFYATGYVVFNLYQNIAAATSQAISFSKPLLMFPAVNWFDALIARFVLNSLTGIIISILLFTGILAVVENRTVLELGPIVEAFGLTMLIGLGVGTLNCALIGLFPVWGVMWGIITRPLFLASCVIYLFEDLPRMAQNILWYNPLVHIVGLTRTGFYVTYTPHYIDTVYVFFVGIILLFFGLLLTHRYNREILNK
ncbi:ABC transporter permease [Roseovarius indicus]|uniref:Polysialic acid transport protein KpsM n=1 Tax=Roseovarius indicus TaxID=540747 RepID=A0A5P3AKN8_9RHOB|nr:ABC transporter permease [Roseovarius indicus]QEW29313.1 Polysialic acid transport protein KpsM [Roseovarius indicus]SFD76300.1 capsular polysaccharide transport system permease protein [Roseovarius indicus]